MVVALEPWGILLAVVALFMAVIQFWVDYEDRVSERTVRAWQLVTTPASGNSGKKAALEYLNKEDGLFCFEWLQGNLEWLHGEDNKDAGCIGLLKPREPLVGIDLSPPSTGTSDDSRGAPVGTYLVDADLTDADLTGANLTGANLSGALLVGADLTGADLRHLLYLKQGQLDKACGDAKTKLRAGFNIRLCE